MAPSQNPNVVINHLNQTRHRMSDGLHPGLFDTPTEINNAEYWILSDLYNMYGNGLGINPYNPIDAQLTPIVYDPKHTTTYSNHVVTFTGGYNKPEPNYARTPVHNARLSRYACWRIMHATNSNPIAMAYFLCPNETFTKIQNVADMISRIQLRKSIAKSEQQIGGILHRTDTNFSAFYRIANQAFFNNTDTDLIKTRNNIELKPKDPISNYLGPNALRERLTALNTIITLYNQRRGQLTILADAAMRVARRNTIDQYGITPEQDIRQQSIKQIETTYNKLQRGFIKSYINESVR